MKSEKIKKYSLSFFRTIFLTIILLLFLELICRIGTYIYYSPNGSSFSNQVMGIWRSDSLLIWDNQPNYTFHDESGSINEIGCRVELGDVEMPKKEKGETWILLSGGSAMLGTGSIHEGDYLTITQITDHSKSTAIDGYLEEELNKSGKGKFKVFNSAVSGHTSRQAFLKVQQLLKKYDFDWVISMDGQNDPGYIPEGKSANDISKSYWKSFIESKHPFIHQLEWMKRSALIFCVLRGKYNFSESLKEEPNREAIIEKWNNYKGERSFLSDTNLVKKGVALFQQSITQQNEWLDQQGIKHLHFIQPHLSLREKVKMAPLEKTVYNYYGSLKRDTLSTFMRDIHQLKWKSPKIMSLPEVHHLPFWVFTDYCHLTKEANQYIAHSMFQHILKGE